MKPKDVRALKAWTERVTRGQKESAAFCSLWSDKMASDPSSDPIPVMQLGYAMLLDKPIVVVAPHGSQIPENVRRAAKVVEFYDRADQASLHAATLRALAAIGVEVPH